MNDNFSDTCEPSVTVHHHDGVWGNQIGNFGPENALSFEQCETATTLYLAPNNAKNHKLILDLGCEVAIKEFVFRNTRNRGFNDRLAEDTCHILWAGLFSTKKILLSSGTKNFTVETSYDMSEWTMVIDEVMESAIGINICEIPLQKFSAPAHGRYVKFTAVTHYGAGSGLNYLTWHFLT